MFELRNRREQLKGDGVIHAETGFPASLTLIVAMALLAIDIVAVGSMAFDVGPFR